MHGMTLSVPGGVAGKQDAPSKRGGHQDTEGVTIEDEVGGGGSSSRGSEPAGTTPFWKKVK